MNPHFRVKTLFVVAFAFLFFAVAAFVLTGQTTRPQAQTLTPVVVNQPEKLTAGAPAAIVSAPLPATAAFLNAAAQNTALKNNIVWTFGGKSQRGWHIYECLIQNLINAETDSDANRFAESLSRWQQTVNLPNSGVLDETALAEMVKMWQSRRLKFTGSASPEELLTAPAADFWDATRAAELRRVERETYIAYKKMIAAAAADKTLKLTTNIDGSLAESEKFLKIISSFRSPEYQAKLRAASPNSGRAGLAVHSPHFSGRALDIYVGGEPVSTKDANRAVQVSTPVYQWLVKNAGKYGFKPYFYEPWHWEYAPDVVPQ